MKEEIFIIAKNHTWKLVDKHSNKNTVGFKWIYRTKLSLYGSINKFKPRLVAKGYSQ